MRNKILQISLVTGLAAHLAFACYLGYKGAEDASKLGYEKISYFGKPQTIITAHHDEPDNPNRITELKLEPGYYCLNDLFRKRSEFYFFSEEIDLPFNHQFKIFGNDGYTRMCLIKK